MRALISACLLGVECKYNGGSNALPKEVLAELAEKYELVPVCPEAYGGLPTPRPPSERVGDRVLSKMGGDVTENFNRGAEAALQLCKLLDCRLAMLKERSPSCGHDYIYDGSFTGTVVPGDGLAAELLRKNGIPVYGESEIESLL